MIDKMMITLDVDSEGNEIRMTSEGFCVWYKDTQQSEYLSLKDCVMKMHAVREHKIRHYLIWDDGSHEVYVYIDLDDKVWFRAVPQEGDVFKYETLKEALEVAGVLDTPQHRNIDWDVLEVRAESIIEENIETDCEIVDTSNLDFSEITYQLEIIQDKINKVKDMIPCQIDSADIEVEVEVREQAMCANEIISMVKKELGVEG